MVLLILCRPGGWYAAAATGSADFRSHSTSTARRLDDPAERARRAVTNRIRDALARIETGQSALGRHLRTSIRTGTFCSYQPERTVAWEARAGR